MPACSNHLISKFCMPLLVAAVVMSLPNNVFGVSIFGFESNVISESVSESVFPDFASGQPKSLPNIEKYTVDCGVSIVSLEIADCVDDIGFVDIALSGTATEDFISIEFLIDDALYFFEALVSNGQWNGNFLVEGNTLFYALAIAGNSESGCTFYYVETIDLPTEICANEPPEFLNLIFEFPQSCVPVSAEVRLYDPGSVILKHTFTVDFNEELGAYQIVNPPIGFFDAFIKPLGCLQYAQGQVMIQAGTQTLTLQNPVKGDLNNSNSINIVDVSLLSQAFNSFEGDLEFNSIADFNCSGGVNILDVSILSQNFNLEGDATPVDIPEE